MIRLPRSLAQISLARKVDGSVTGTPLATTLRAKSGDLD